MFRSSPVPTGQPARIAQMAGKYLIFELAGEEFGIGVLQVKEIVKLQEITRVPQAPPYLEGVINLRGRIVPVVNLRKKFNRPEQAHTERTCIVVVQVQTEAGDQAIGVVVDGVVEVFLAGADDIEDPPDFGRDPVTSYVKGMAKSKGRVRILLDIDLVLARQEIADLTLIKT